MKKYIAAGLLAVLLLAGVISPGSPCLGAPRAEAAEEAEARLGGYRIYYTEEAPEEAAASAKDSADESAVLHTQRKAAHSGAAYGMTATYTNDVFYNRMTIDERALYHALYGICETYLNGTENAETVSGYGTFTKSAPYEGLTSKEARNVAVVFGLSNPQFYFLSDAVLITHYTDSDAGNIRLSVYEAFVDGAARLSETAKLFAVIAPMVSEVKAETQPLDQVRIAHDLVCAHVTYDNAALEQGTEGRHQSCYTAFMEGLSVCAGYAEAVGLLLNAAGVPVISVTSTTHEWNEVYLDGYWYLLDATWDDNDYGVVYDYYLKSDATALGMNYRSRTYHTKEAFWADFDAPLCRYDYGAAPADGGLDTERPAYKIAYDIGDTADVPDGGVPMYRLYNKYTGEHIYTADTNEAAVLKNRGWRYEGRAWNAPAVSAQPVFRLYNPYADEHLYTTDLTEREALGRIGWVDEGAGWYSDPLQRTPLYRLYNPNEPANNHFYTGDAHERNVLVSYGWRDEGVGWYGM